MNITQENKTKIQSNRREIFELEALVNANKAQVYATRATIEQNYTSIMRNFSSAFLGNNNLNTQNTDNKMVDKLRELKIKQNRTPVDDMINNSIANWEMEYGSDDTTDSEELLQLQSNGNSQSIRWRYD